MTRKILKFFSLLLFAGILVLGLYYYSSNEPQPVPLETVRVTIPEGFNVRQIGEALEKAGMFRKEEFIAKAQDEEGYLFPDTYDFYKISTPEKVILKMRENFDLKVGGRVEKEKLKEIIILASILEEEAATPKDWKIIAGILLKRTEAKMPLQVDATLTYITGKTSAEMTDEDLALASPYNTYKNLGLPPGPISNPGINVIDAALNPEKSPYWYYLSDKNGVIHYAKTFEQHKINKQKYIR